MSARDYVFIDCISDLSLLSTVYSQVGLDVVESAQIAGRAIPMFNVPRQGQARFARGQLRRGDLFISTRQILRRELGHGR